MSEAGTSIGDTGELCHAAANLVGAGAPCQDKLSWAQTMIDEQLTALRCRRLALSSVLFTGDSWFVDSKLVSYVRQQYPRTLLA